MFGWATMGVFLIIKGLILDAIYDKFYCSGYSVAEDCFDDYDDYEDYSETSSYTTSSYTTSSSYTTTTATTSAKLQQQQINSAQLFGPLSAAKLAKKPAEADVLVLIQQFLEENGHKKTLAVLNAETSNSPVEQFQPIPTRRPAERPTRRPTTRPTRQPAERPTRRPTTRPTRRPAERPTRRPTTRPTRQPAERPTRRPTTRPTRRPAMEFEYSYQDPNYYYEDYYEDKPEKLVLETTAVPPTAFTSVLLQTKPTRPNRLPSLRPLQLGMLENEFKEQLLQQKLELEELQNLRLQQELNLLKLQSQRQPKIPQRQPQKFNRPKPHSIQIVTPATTTQPEFRNSLLIQPQQFKLPQFLPNTPQMQPQPQLSSNRQPQNQPKRKPPNRVRLRPLGPPIKINQPTTHASVLIRRPPVTQPSRTNSLTLSPQQMHLKQQQQQQHQQQQQLKQHQQQQQHQQPSFQPSEPINNMKPPQKQEPVNKIPIKTPLPNPLLNDIENAPKHPLTLGKKKRKTEDSSYTSVLIQPKTEGSVSTAEGRTTPARNYTYYPGRRHDLETGDQLSGAEGHQLRVGDWVAVWDTEFLLWYFHNLVTGESTWQKPPQLRHLSFKKLSTKGN